MGEHRARIEIGQPAKEVFAFLANPMNLPRWLPMLREVIREGPDRIRAIGGGLGAQGVAAHARFDADIEGRHLVWSAASGVGCAGDIRVQEAPNGSVIELCIRLGQKAERPDVLAGWTGDPSLDVQAALRATLAAVKEVCEGRRESVGLVSGGTQSHPDDDRALRDSRAYGEAGTQNPDTV